MTKSNITRLITGLIVIFTTFQASVPAMPITDQITKTIVSATFMFIVVALTAWNQYLSVEIRNGSMWPTFIIAVLAVLGGFNDLVNAVPISPALGQWLRFGITTITAILNISSKTLWPTYESKVVEATKQDLAASKL